MKRCMPESSWERLSRLASFTNTQSQWHSSAISLVQSSPMGHFSSLRSFRSSAHNMNTRTAHSVDICVFFTTIGFLAASISSLEIVASKTLLRLFLLRVWLRALLSGTKSSSVNWERPFRAAVSTIMAKTGELESDSELASPHCTNIQIQIARNAHDVTAILSCNSMQWRHRHGIYYMNHSKIGFNFFAWQNPASRMHARGKNS